MTSQFDNQTSKFFGIVTGTKERIPRIPSKINNLFPLKTCETFAEYYTEDRSPFYLVFHLESEFVVFNDENTTKSRSKKRAHHTEVNVQLGSKFKPSFPKAIVLMAVVCMVLMVKFKHPHANFFKKESLKRSKVAQLKQLRMLEPIPSTKSFIKKEDWSQSQTNLSVKEELKAYRKMGPGVDEVRQTPVIQNTEPIKPEVVKTKKATPTIVKKVAPKIIGNCLASLGKLKVNQIRVSKKTKLPTQTETKKVEPIKTLPTEPAWIENAFDEELSDDGELLALNTTTPLDELSDIGLTEISLSDSFDANPLLAAVNMKSESADKEDIALLPNLNEPRLQVKEGTFERIEFTDLVNSLKKLREEGEMLAELKTAPEPKIAKNVLVPTDIKIESETILNTHSSEKTDPVLIANENVSEKKADDLGEQLIDAGSKTDQVVEPQDTTEELEEDEPTIVKMFNRKSLEVTPKLAAIGGSFLNNQAKPDTSKFNPPVTTHKKERLINQNSGVDNEDIQGDGGMLYGTLEADNRFVQWLEENKGHVELYLNPIDSKDPQDTIYKFDYQFPLHGPDFEINVAKITGKYRLVAGVFLNSPTPVAEIEYSKPISAGTYKQKVYLRLKKEDVDTQNRNRENRASNVQLSLTATVFEGAGGNYRQAKPIKNAEVSVVGFPELGEFKTDNEGNIRIANVPPHSEFMLSIRATGYYTSRQVVPVFSTSVYAPLYLVQKDKVETITKFFTKKEQAEGKSVIMGRVFDTSSRVPMAEQEVALSFRKGSALYFEALPDPKFKSTRTSGLFGFFNVEPSFRSIYRSGGKYPMLLNVDANMGIYVEMGRGGARSLRSNLFDPFAAKAVHGKVRLVGGDVNELYSDNKGNVQIKGLDLPPGIVTLETEADGFPKTWHTLPWSTREPEKKHTLYLLQNDMVLESAISIARIKKQNGTGTVFGGAQRSFFKKGRNKIAVSLMSLEGIELSREQGPFPISQPQQNPNDKLELTPANPGFAFYNVLPGEYILKWKNEKGSTFRSHVLRVGVDRVSVVVN